MNEGSGTRVQIFGHVYHLRGQEDAEHIRQVARLVDDRMNLIADRVQTADSFRIAVLAAIHIADEFLTLKNQHEQFNTDIAQKSSRLVELLGDAVDPEPAVEQEVVGTI